MGKSQPNRVGRLGLSAVAAVGALLLAACGTGGQATSGGEGSGSGSGGAGNERDLTFSVVVHSAPDSAFWNVVKKGALDAGEQYGVDVNVVGDGEGAKQAQLIEAELAKNVDGMVVSLANVDALTPALNAATGQNIPFITINSGAENSAAVGAIGHIGQTELTAGQGAGERLASEGVTNVLCLVHEPGNIGLEQRCDGAAETFGGSMKKLQVDINNLQSTEATVKSALLGDTSVDGVLSLNTAVTTAALAGIEGAGSDAILASFDIDEDVLKNIKDGKVVFTVDQQQYLQGYLAIVNLVLFHDNHNTVGGGFPVLTGPAFITSENVDPIAALVAKGTR